jgi:AraC-like DNA-binding protein
VNPDSKSSVLFFGYTFNESDQLQPKIRVIGHERKEPKDNYDWDCRKYDGKYRLSCLFQYTISGEGEVLISGERHRVGPGQAFLIEKPGPYRYYLSPDADHWEFKFVILNNAFPYFRQITDMTGRVIDIGSDTPIIRLWDRIYRISQARAFADSYHNSLLAYELLMEINRWAAQESPHRTEDAQLQESIKWIHGNFHKPIGLDDVVRTTSFSRTYFTRLFIAQTGETPMKYLARVRIENAANLLIQTSLPVEEIARYCGFRNGNYFGKVFRKVTGAAPGDFRKLSGEQQKGGYPFLG